MGINELDIEATIDALRTLSERLEMLQHMEKAALESPNQQQQHAIVLEDAYAIFARVETSVEELEQELEYYHERLGKTVELRPHPQITSILHGNMRTFPDS